MNEELLFRKILNCANRTEIKNIRKYLNKVTHNWENKVRKYRKLWLITKMQIVITIIITIGLVAVDWSCSC
jgi:hypothetical protein